jgi:hypothetical protein
MTTRWWLWNHPRDAPPILLPAEPTTQLGKKSAKRKKSACLIPPTQVRLATLPNRASHLNAITPIEPEDPAARTARHLRMLAELEELGMQLARATAARALAELAEPDRPEEPAEELLSELPAAAPPPEQAAQSATPRRTAARSPGTPRQTDPVTSFIRLAKAVCELIALEAGLAAGPIAKSGIISAALRADPRRPFLQDAIQLVTEHHSDRTALRRAFSTRCDEILEADPEKTKTLPKIFFPLCEELGIEPDTSKLSDEIIGMDLYTEEDHQAFLKKYPDWSPIPKPRATSPP